MFYFLIRYAQPKINHLAAIVPYAIKGQEYYDNIYFICIREYQ